MFSIVKNGMCIVKKIKLLQKWGNYTWKHDNVHSETCWFLCVRVLCTHGNYPQAFRRWFTQKPYNVAKYSSCQNHISFNQNYKTIIIIILYNTCIRYSRIWKLSIRVANLQDNTLECETYKKAHLNLRNSSLSCIATMC